MGSMPAMKADAPSREHRAMWMTPYLSSNWPSSSITEGNASSMKSILTRRLEKFRDQNVNIIYYHCRSMCDATYESSYEPWSSTVSGTRGKAPAFDPFGFLLQEAHKVGIEVYAWINPYRYSSTASGYGEGELNYENSHPDWLLKQPKGTILNPALEEVKQRIVDVVSEIVTKYDVDGVIFDDYFYISGTPMSADAEQYEAYTKAGGKLGQADWRRANVNEMVARVNAAIKKIKPYVTFGIGPAGVSSPPNVESEYGLTPAPGGGDWQYSGIYSDPLAWLKAGSIDFISPQIYWPSRFDALSEWWNVAAQKYNRHFYPSVDISDIASIKYAEFAREIEKTRAICPSGTSGIVFFQYGDFVNYYEKFNGKSTDFGTILSQDVWNTKALVPLRPWVKSDAPSPVTNVALNGQTLTWDLNAAGRYAIYRDLKASSSRNIELVGISYVPSYDTGSDGDQYEWFVASYDRYGKTAVPVQVGATVSEGTAPVLTYPADGEKPVDLFDFCWTHSSTLRHYTVEVSDDANFEHIIGNLDVKNANKASVTGLPTLTEGNTYYWRVKADDVNRVHPVSETRSFVASRIAMTSPSNQSTNIAVSPTMTWTAAVEGAEYTLEIARSADMSNNVYTTTVSTPSCTVPECVLNSGRQYYARVTASKDGATSTSAIVAFKTVDRTDYSAPTILNPAAQDGQTIHANEKVIVAPWNGMVNVTVQIAATSSFPTRSLYTATLSDFATETPELGNAKISSKNLEDGKTYYLRARGSYMLTTSTATQYTDWTPTYTFVYSAEAGVDDVTADEAAGTVLLNATTLRVTADVDVVTVYTLTGAVAAVYEGVAGSEVDLSGLPAGTYVIAAGKTALKYIR